MKQKLFVAMALMISNFSFAHIEPGVYIGETPDGEECSIEAIRQYYVDNFKHPLNERIELELDDGTKFTVNHPAVISAEKETAGFNHDAFHGIKPTKVGATALVIDMKHENGKEGHATAFHVIEHNWKDKKVKALHCLDIEAVE